MFATLQLKYHCQDFDKYIFYCYEKSIFTLESAEEEAVANFVATKLFGGIKTEEGYNSLMSLKNENKGIIRTFIDFVKHLKNKFFGDKRTRTLGEDLNYIEERLQQVLLSKEKATTEAVAEKHLISEIVGESGKNYGIGVYLDSEKISNLSESERIEKVRNHIKQMSGKLFYLIN